MKNSFYIDYSTLDEPFPIPNLKDNRINLLTGPVKSGKTLCLLYKCKSLLMCNPKANIIWITHNKLYKDYLNSLFHKIGIHCRIELASKFLECQKFNCDYIFIDEASFLTESQFAQIINCSNKSIFISINDGSIKAPFIFKDGQSGLTPNSVRELYNVIPQSLYFTPLCNGTEKIISHLCDLYSVAVKSIGNNVLNQCYYIELTEQESIVKFINKRITNLEEKDVGILCNSNEDVANLYHEFNNHQFKVECKYNYTKEWRNNINFESTHPKIMTIHSSIGISFGSIYLILNKRLLTDFSKYRDLICYALTRGLNDVVIIGCHTLPIIITDNALQISDGTIISL